MYYHASQIKDIKVLEPRKSNHNIPLVYLSVKRENTLVWIVVPCDDDGIIPNDIEIPTDNEIYAQISFQEQFFCGVIVK